MNILDWIILSVFLLILVGIAFLAYLKVKKSNDFYMAGGKLPWYIAGVSHHVSGYSAVAFTGYVAIAYKYGFTLYIWWAVNIALACVIGAYTIMPRWSRLRSYLNVESPTEYLKLRYNIPTQQLVAWSGVLLKLLDVAGKYTAIGLLLQGFTGLPFFYGVLLTGVVTLIYVTVGGLWADTFNDFFQFIIQVVAGVVMFFIVGKNLGKMNVNFFSMWEKLPADHANWFNGPYSLSFFLVFILVVFLSYNGGTWNLATRFLAAPSGVSAKKSGLLSGALYLFWPLIMFAPMWAAPLLFPDIATSEQNQLYAKMTTSFLPNGLIGLVLSSMFAATLSMVASDSNAISSVISRDIVPVLAPKFHKKNQGNTPLFFARTVTFLFTLFTLLISLNNQYFGGVIGLIIKWFGALLGPTAIPMVLGLLPPFKKCGPIAACGSIIVGLLAFILVNYAPGIFGVEQASLSLSIGFPIISSLIFFLVCAVIGIDKQKPEVKDLLEKLSRETN